MKMRRKGDLPQKTCAACGRPFAWRRKWARDWENVRYCSQSCRSKGANAEPVERPARNGRVGGR